MRELVSKSSFEVRPYNIALDDEANPWTELNRKGFSLTSHGHTKAKETKESNSGVTYTVTQVLDLETNDAAFSVDDNEVTEALLFGKLLPVLQVRETPFPNAVGTKIYTYHGPATIVWNSPFSAQGTYDVSIMVDGDIVESLVTE